MRTVGYWATVRFLMHTPYMRTPQELATLPKPDNDNTFSFFLRKQKEGPLSFDFFVRLGKE